MNVALLHNTTDVIGSAKQIQKQIPFALSKALNATGLDVQKFAYEKQLPSKLTIRNQWAKPRSKYGINMLKFATKTSLTAEVGSRAPWLDSQERGATIRPKGKFRIVPIVGTAARTTKSAKVPRRLKPSKSGGSVFFVKRYQAFARRVGGSRNKRLQILFNVAKVARVKPRLQFVSSAEREARRVFDSRFDTAFAAAWASAK